MKKIAFNKLSTWLIIVGVLLILAPLVGSAYTNYQQEMYYKDYLANAPSTEESYEDLQNAFVDLQQSDLAAATGTNQTTEPAKPAPPAYKPTVLGRIQVPKIDEDLLLVEGVKKADLRLGAGHIPGTSLPGEIGNCAIAGHRNYTFGSFFNRLDELQIGDKVTIDFNKKKYTYVAYEKLVVLPEDTSVINKNDKDKILTLITCTPVRIATHRLIIHFKLVE